MRHVFRRALVLAMAALTASAQADVMMVPTGSDAKPVPVAPPPVSEESPEEIAKDAARDLDDTNFYNRPGATRAQYDADWQACRLIARGSRTPAGTIPYYYNPAVVSPLAAGIGAGIGGMIGAAIVQGQQRRANRRACLLIKGWRLVQLPSIAPGGTATTPDQRDVRIGAATVAGKITERTSFSLPPDPALDLDAPIAGPGAVYLGKKVDPAAPFALGPGEAAIVLGYRRPDAGTAGRSGLVQLARYDMASRDLVYQPSDWKKKGDRTTYLVGARSGDKLAPYEVQVIKVTPGDYVITGTAVGTLPIVSTNCFGAPAVHVGEGEIVYLGDFLPYWNVRKADGSKLTALAYAAHIEDARKALAAGHPDLAAKLTPGAFHNRATYACAAVVMDRWDLPNADALPDPAPVLPAAAAPTSATSVVTG